MKFVSQPSAFSPGPLRRVTLDEPLGAWVATCGPAESAAALEACGRLPRDGKITLVLRLAPELPGGDAAAAITRAGTVADTLVVVASEADRLRWGALGAHDLRALARGPGQPRVLLEPDPQRAVLGAMQWLRPGDTICVIWPREPGEADPEALITRAARWRGAWDEPEDGEFHTCPRGPDGLYTDDHQAPEARTTQGEENR